MDHPDLTRTLAALAAYDALELEFLDDLTPAVCHVLLQRSDAAKLEIGEAFALDTSDRNDPEIARSWAAFNVERTRAFVLRLTSGKDPLRILPAEKLAPGDIIRDNGNRWKVDTATINPRRKCGTDPNDMLVDVDATGVGFIIPCKRFSSHKTQEVLFVELPDVPGGTIPDAPATMEP